jgi:PmbA protein
VSPSGRLKDVLASLSRAGCGEAEVYAKTGRSRQVAFSLHGELVSMSEEAGWAVRASQKDGGFFWAATGEPEPLERWPAPTGRPWELPAAERGEPWSEPKDFEAPLLAERESLSLLAGIGNELARELPGARLASAQLEEGAAESHLASSRGVEASWRSRLAALRLEATAAGGRSLVLGLAEREARRFQPKQIARRLANALSLMATGRPARSRGRRLLLGPGVATRLLAGMVPLWAGTGRALLERAADPEGRIAGPSVTLVDDGRLPNGVLEAPWGGAGQPTRSRSLIEAGLLSPACALALGEVRPSWREPPRAGASHFYLRPAPRVSVAALLGLVTDGFYLIEATGAGRFELGSGIFRLPVLGFEVAAGQVAGPIAGSELVGTIPAFLAGIEAVGRDLSFLPADGLVGSPSLVVVGLDLVEGEG